VKTTKVVAAVGRKVCLLVVATLAPLAACSSAEPAVDGSDSPPEARASVPSAETPKSPESLYLETVRRGTNLSTVSDSALLQAGQESCGALNRGVAPVEVLGMAMETGDDGVAILGTAVGILCREHLPAMERLAGTLN